MEEKYLILNAGSSSLKFTLYSMPSGVEEVTGTVERIGSTKNGTPDSTYTIKFRGEKITETADIKDHKIALDIVLKELLDRRIITCLEEINGVGHRIVHGGEKYQSSALIDDEVVQDIDDLTKFAKLHHPGHLKVINRSREIFPTIPQVAVFDTAFHQTMKEENYRYAVPKEWYEKYGVRKYGAHGTSHKYITETVQQQLNKEDVNVIVCHIGSGASISLIENGKCANTSMGLTPLDGLIMGTRSGSIDPSILEYMATAENLTIDELTDILNKKSGLKGICGYNDYRDVESLAKEGNKDAILALNMLRNSIVKYIAQYYFEIHGQLDAIIFTAGIGENSASLREGIVEAISDVCGIKLNKEENEKIAGFKPQKSGIISTEDSRFIVGVLPTDEELMILTDTYEISHKALERNDSPKMILK